MLLRLQFNKFEHIQIFFYNITNKFKFLKGGMSYITNPEHPEDLALDKMVRQELLHIIDDKSTQNTQQEETNQTSNVYFDKQLTHLVLTQEFDFEKISKLLTQLFKHDKINTSAKACRSRWSFLHKNRHKLGELKQTQKQNKRIRSIMAFSNPYSLYNVEQLIQNLQHQEKQATPSKTLLQEPTAKGYNIMKDSFRKITNLEQYNELESKMKAALKKAQQQVYEEAPMYFTPRYQNLQKFQVNVEQLTPQKSKQIMAFKIQMESIGRQLAQQKEQQQYSSVIKQKIKKQKCGDFNQDWDQYESD